MPLSGDYFGGEEVAFNLPSLATFNANRSSYITPYDCEHLGIYLIKEPITPGEEQKIIRSYQKLANTKVRQSEIDTIYTINDANYIPFSSTLEWICPGANVCSSY